MVCRELKNCASTTFHAARGDGNTQSAYHMQAGRLPYQRPLTMFHQGIVGRNIATVLLSNLAGIPSAGIADLLSVLAQVVWRWSPTISRELLFVNRGGGIRWACSWGKPFNIVMFIATASPRGGR